MIVALHVVVEAETRLGAALAKWEEAEQVVTGIQAIRSALVRHVLVA